MIYGKASSTRLRRHGFEDTLALLEEYRRFRGVVSAFVAVSESLIGGRLKHGGLHWGVDGANAIVALRSPVHSNRFDDFRERRAA